MVQVNFDAIDEEVKKVESVKKDAEKAEEATDQKKAFKPDMKIWGIAIAVAVILLAASGYIMFFM